MRAAIAAESGGIASVSIVCPGFEAQARATARGMGYDYVALATTQTHVDAQSHDELVATFVGSTVGAIIDGLTVDPGVESADCESATVSEAESSALDIVARGTSEEVTAEFYRQGWTDGNAIVVPTEARVQDFLAGSGHDQWKRLGVSPSSGRDLTIRSIAVNAVMAGCDPEHLPILVAITEILADPAYGSEHSGNTTGADALIVLGGPGVKDRGFSFGPGVQREGTHANTSVGRWLRLYLRNVCGFGRDTLDKATFGNPARPVLAQDFAQLETYGWPTVAEQVRIAGPARKADTDSGADEVTLVRINSGVLIGSVFGSIPEQIVDYLADGLIRATSWELTHVCGLGTDQYQPLLIISPLLLKTLGQAGWSLADFQTSLYQRARIPASRFERYIGEWTNLTAGQPRLFDLVRDGILPPVFGASTDPDRLVPLVTRPEQVIVAVAGDQNRANAYAMSNDGPHGWWTSKTISDRRPTDLLCRL